MRLERRVLGDGWTHLRRQDKASLTSSFIPPPRPPPGTGKPPELAASSSHGAILPTPPPSFKQILLSPDPSRRSSSLLQVPSVVAHPIFAPLPSLPVSSFQGRCFRCLAPDHLVRHCRSPVRCIRCNNLGHVARRCTAVNLGCCPPPPPSPPPPPPPPSPPVTHVLPPQPHVAANFHSHLLGLGGDRPFFGCWACGALMAIVPLPFEDKAANVVVSPSILSARSPNRIPTCTAEAPPPSSGEMMAGSRSSF